MHRPTISFLAVLAFGSAGIQSVHAAAEGNTSWKPMREVVFDSTVFKSTGSAQDREMMKALWAEELSAPRDSGPGQKLPAFTLVGDVEISGRHLVFSMFSAAGNSLCEDTGNGSGMSDIYSVCTMRVAFWPKGMLPPFDVPKTCAIFADEDRKNNHIEYMMEPAQNAIRFRTIQYGKLVPECSRTLKLK